MSGDLNANSGVCSLRNGSNKLNDLWVDCDNLSCPTNCCTKCGSLGLSPVYL